MSDEPVQGVMISGDLAELIANQADLSDWAAVEEYVEKSTNETRMMPDLCKFENAECQVLLTNLAYNATVEEVALLFERKGVLRGLRVQDRGQMLLEFATKEDMDAAFQRREFTFKHRLVHIHRVAAMSNYKQPFQHRSNRSHQHQSGNHLSQALLQQAYDHQLQQQQLPYPQPVMSNNDDLPNFAVAPDHGFQGFCHQFPVVGPTMQSYHCDESSVPLPGVHFLVPQPLHPQFPQQPPVMTNMVFYQQPEVQQYPILDTRIVPGRNPLQRNILHNQELGTASLQPTRILQRPQQSRPLDVISHKAQYQGVQAKATEKPRAPKAPKASPFGDAKPVDSEAKMREIELKRQLRETVPDPVAGATDSTTTASTALAGTANGDQQPQQPQEPQEPQEQQQQRQQHEEGKPVQPSRSGIRVVRTFKNSKKRLPEPRGVIPRPPQAPTTDQRNR